MRLLAFLSIVMLFGACSPEEETKPPVVPQPAWAEGFPLVLHGATTVDLIFKTETSSEVYYLLSDRPLPYTAEELKTKAEFPDTSAIKYAGRLALNSGAEWSKTFPLLEENKKYFSYVVRESRSGGVLSDISAREFTTYSRQDTAVFQSIAENRTVTYLIYRPEQTLKHPEIKTPVCFSFANKNGIGTDLKPVNLVRDGSPAEYIYHKNDVPMIVVSIQPRTVDWNLSLIEEGIDHVLATYPVDQNRIYLTGYGEGAIASWNYAITHADQIAAIVPVSGKGDTFNACNLATVDVWAFHNETDDIIASSNTKKMVSNINKCSPQKELSEIYFPDAGHNCWKRVYNSNHPDWSKSPGIGKFNIYAWMLSKSKS